MKCIAMLVVLAACGGRDTGETKDVKLGSLTFEVPSAWQRTNTERTGTRSAMWTPSGMNEHKESVMVLRAAGRRFGDARLAELLASAQATLAGARVSPVAKLTTRQGLSGAQIEVSFEPGNGTTRYRRVHAVLVDAKTSELVHVLYTAVEPDEKLAAFYTVLESLHEES